MWQHVIVIVVETNDMNPLVGSRPRRTLCRGLPIGVVRLPPTNRNRDAILKCHRESLVVGVVVEIDEWERIGDGVGVAHGGIVPKWFGGVNPYPWCGSPDCLRSHQSSRSTCGTSLPILPCSHSQCPAEVHNRRKHCWSQWYLHNGRRHR